MLEDELNVICATRASAGESAAMVLAGGLILLGQNCAHGFLQDHGWGGQQDDGHAQLLLKTMSAVSGYRGGQMKFSVANPGQDGRR